MKDINRDDHAWCLSSPHCMNIMCYRHTHNIVNTDVPHSFTDRSAFPECIYPEPVDGQDGQTESTDKTDDATIAKVKPERNKWHVLEDHPYDLPEHWEPVLVITRSALPSWNLVKTYSELVESYALGFYDHLYARWNVEDVVAWHPIPKYTSQEG